MVAANAAENCATAELTLIKPPRCSGSTLLGIIAIAGTNRPVIEIIKKVEEAPATVAGTTGKWVDRNAATIEQHIMIVKILIRPNRSANRPTPFMVKSVAPPPLKYTQRSSPLFNRTLETR